MSDSELACVYSALILHDAGVTVSADKMTKLIKAANVEVEPIWATLFARALEGKDIGSLICNVGSGVAAGGGGGGAAGGASAADEETKEEKKEEPKKEESEDESDDDMGFGLFD